MASIYAIALLIAALLLGGGGGKSGYLSDAILQFLAIPVLVFALWRLSFEKLNRSATLAIALCLALVAVHLIQLLPLPPQMRAMLPGYEVVASSLNVAGLKLNWFPISVSPRATWLSLAALLPPLTMFLITLLLGYRDRRLLSVVIIVFGIVSVLIGMLQVAQGYLSPLRFYGADGPPEANGFFANRNHFSALVYSIILFLAAWIASHLRNVFASGRAIKIEAGVITFLIVSVSLIVVLIGAQMMIRSRAGTGLTILALFGGYALTLGRDRSEGMAKVSRKIVISFTVLVLAFIFSTQFALYRILDRLDDSLLESGRSIIVRTTLEAAWSFMPTGAGMGTFVPVYAMFEKASDVRADQYINRAHNDVLEFWLEAGTISLILMALFGVFYITRTIYMWRQTWPGAQAIDQTLARSATIIIGLLIAHSLVDYPLRTGALASVFAYSCALLIDPVSNAQETKEGWVDALLNWLGGGATSARRGRSSQQAAAGGAKASNTADRFVPPASVADTKKPPLPIDQTQWGKDIQWPSEWGDGKPSDKDRDGN